MPEVCFLQNEAKDEENTFFGLMVKRVIITLFTAKNKISPSIYGLVSNENTLVHLK